MNMTPGTYRNRLGIELVVTGPFAGPVARPYQVLGGDIAIAKDRDELFGATWLVTAASLQDAGYELIKEKS